MSDWKTEISKFYQSIKSEDPLLAVVPLDLQSQIMDLSILDFMSLPKIEEVQISTIRRSMTSASEFYDLISGMQEMDSEFEYQFAVVLMILYAARKQNNAGVLISTENIDLILSYIFSPSKSPSIINRE